MTPWQEAADGSWTAEHHGYVLRDGPLGVIVTRPGGTLLGTFSCREHAESAVMRAVS